MQHRGHTIEKLLAGLDLAFEHVAPRDRYPQRGARLAVGACRRRKTRKPKTAFAAIALCDIQRHRAERPPELLAQIAVMPPNATNNRRERPDGYEGNVENLKTRDRAMRLFCLHAPPSDKKRDSAPRNPMTKSALARFFRTRAGKQNRRIAPLRRTASTMS
jgi:hypothetical protein